MEWKSWESEGLRMTVGFWLGQLREGVPSTGREGRVGFVRHSELSLVTLKDEMVREHQEKCLVIAVCTEPELRSQLRASG